MNAVVFPAHDAQQVHTSPQITSAPFGICNALRDTALLVTLLSTGGKALKLGSLRAYCDQLITQFDASLEQSGYASDIREDALIAQCALLDETALRHLDEDDKFTWASHPLQVSRFSKHDAGERVFERLHMRMRESSPHADLLLCYAEILSLGFRGRYVVEGETKRYALMAELDALLARSYPRAAQPFMREAGSHRIASWLRRFSPWAIAGAAILFAFIAWLSWHMALDTQLAAFLSQAAKT